MNYKEFFGRYEHSVEGRHQMGEQQAVNLQEKYRMSGARGQGLSFEQFVDMRKSQMSQLYNAYVELNQGRYNRLMGPRDAGDTSEEALRRVTGPNMTYNNGFIAVDATDRSILSAISQEAHQGYTSRVGAYDANTIVDNVEALHSIAERTSGEMLPINRVLRETDVLKTEMYKTSHEYRSNTYEDYSQYHPQPKGLLAKIYKAVGKLVDPQKFAEKENSLNEQEVPGLEDY